MKIAQVTPLYEAVPPKLYGGTERVVAHLTDALVDLGHDVTLFASADAETKARLVPVRDQAIRLDPAPLKSDLAAHMTMLAEVLDRAETAVPGVGALRLRLVATKGRDESMTLKGQDGKYAAGVLLDLDYWALAPQ